MGLIPTTSAPLTCYACCEKSERHPEDYNGCSPTAFSTTRGTTLIFFVSFFVSLFVCWWVTNTGEQYSWPLSSEGSLACQIYTNGDMRFVLVISEDPYVTLTPVADRLEVEQTEVCRAIGNNPRYRCGFLQILKLSQVNKE